MSSSVSLRCRHPCGGVTGPFFTSSISLTASSSRESGPTWAGGRDATHSMMSGSCGIDCGRRAGAATTWRITRIDAAITASGPGPGGCGRRWSFCSRRFSLSSHMALDSLGRPLRDLRVSVTDRCNFRCTYCMPREIFGRDFAFLRRDELLTFEEIARLARSFVNLGVEKIRLTGGVPLLRRDLERLVQMLSRIGGLQDLTLTTNGSLLTREKAQALKDAGLNRITISLDSLDDDVFRGMNDVDFPVGRVLDAIDAAADAGLWPIKIDCVVKRGINDRGIVDMARRFRGSGHILRFIEYMDVGTTNGWRLDDAGPGREIVETIGRERPIEPLQS